MTPDDDRKLIEEAQADDESNSFLRGCAAKFSFSTKKTPLCQTAQELHRMFIRDDLINRTSVCQRLKGVQEDGGSSQLHGQSTKPC